MNTNEDKVVQFLVLNQLLFFEKTTELRQRRDELLKKEDYCFHDEIRKQYRVLVKELIVDETTKTFALPAEDVILVIENLNLNEYLKEGE